jgi:hypothetical protein
LPKVPLPIMFSRSIDESALPDAIGARLVNGYVQKIGPIPFIRKAPGREVLSDLSSLHNVDGLFWWDQKGWVIAVCNGQIYLLYSPQGNWINITGDALAVMGPVSFAASSTELIMASGGKMVTLGLLNRATTSPALAIGSTTQNVAYAAIAYWISTTRYTKAVNTVGVAPGTDVIPQGKYGAVALDIDSAGTVNITSARYNTTGYTTAALAVADIPPCMLTRCRMGTVSAMKSDSAFTFGTTALNAGSTTVAYTNATTVGEVTTTGINSTTISPKTAFIDDANAPLTVTAVDFMDGYYFAKSGKSWYWSNFGQNGASGSAPQSWPATNFITPQSKGDGLASLKIAYREISVFGKTSIEFWFNDGSTPFSRIEGTNLEKGCIAPASIVNASGAWMWLDNERRVNIMEARQPKVLSGPYDDVIRDLIKVSDAVGLYMAVGQQSFYVLTFPTENVTFVYNLTSDTWAEWGAWDATNGKYTAWQGFSYCYATDWQMHLVGDNQGRIHRLRSDFFQNAGVEIRTLIRTAPVSHGTIAKKKRCDELFFRCRRGQGNEAGSEPVFTWRRRDDGKSWGNEHQISLGKIGDYDYLQRLVRLGTYTTRQHELIHTDNSDFILAEMEENITEMS